MNTVNEKNFVSINGASVHVTKREVKNLHLSVLPPNGRVRVTAPTRMNDDAIRMSIISRLSWIKKQQLKFQVQERQTIREFVSGESHYYLGKSYKLKLISTSNKPSIFIKGKTQIIMQVPKIISIEKKDDLLKRWYRAQMRVFTDKLVLKWVNKMNLKPTKVGVRHMKTRWGSCNQNTKTIWLNLELIKKPSACIEYVLVHEFCHLIEKKHNDKFLNLMEMHIPKWKMYKDELNRLPLSFEKWSY